MIVSAHVVHHASSMTCFASAGVQVAWSPWHRGRKVVGAWNAAACSRHSAPTIRRIIVLVATAADGNRPVLLLMLRESSRHGGDCCRWELTGA